MRLSDMCHAECGKHRENGFSFILNAYRYDFCSEECLQKKLDDLKRREKASRFQ